ncbi:MAG TPA: DNA gyrase inhibitor YacG [Acidiphilium sp.]|nr:MAG: hypothetical protein B7Z67_10100 [Acidiphilium sp. 21-60-14]OYV89578.1 MAG: hypothetical protein B7Z57_12270 [Acidiphilium sp. 37-60-79]OZB39126.1 MAG: hypothetical protein B7X48_10360 [Acidiphilium sp. 34-60-192]HQT88745.1 DNA gyrase inhibitor YacG [Acidiphilium sp.]HQU23894.1 DNA gyrase inhibitor YacG [Acidiphilium sp.]
MTNPPPAKPCPICGKPPDPTHAPFCSPRCRTIDLGRWFNEDYALPATTPLDPDS